MPPRIAIAFSSSSDYEEDVLTNIPIHKDTGETAESIHKRSSGGEISSDYEYSEATIPEPVIEPEPITVPVNVEAPTSVPPRDLSLALPNPPIYRCKRSRKLVGYPSFEFYLREELLLTATRKSATSHRLVMKGTSGDIIADCHVSGSKNRFTLFNHDSHDALAQIRFTAVDFQPRNLKFDITDPKTHFTAKRPVFNERKLAWQHDYGTHFVVKSNKNCVIIDDRQLVSFYLMKIDRDNLEIKAIHTGLDMKYMFMLGIASFMCKL